MLRSIDIDIGKAPESLGGQDRGVSIAKQLVGMLSSDRISQVSAIKTVLNSRATLLFVTSDETAHSPPHLYQWTADLATGAASGGLQGEPSADEALDAASRAILASSGVLAVDAFRRMLAGQFIAVPSTTLKAFFHDRPDSLCLHLVGHGQTVDRGNGLLRQFQRFDAASLAAYLVDHIFRFAGTHPVGSVWIKLMACKQLVEAEACGDDTSFVGQFLQRLSMHDAMIASRTIVTAATCAVGFPSIGFMARDEAVLGTFPLTMSAAESSRMRFNGWQSFALYPMPGRGRATIFRFPALSNAYSSGEMGLVGAYLSARRSWKGWSHAALPDRFSLLGMLGNLKLILTHAGDIDVVLLFLTGLGLTGRKTAALGEAEAATTTTTTTPGLTHGQTARAASTENATMQINHGQVAWVSDERQARRLVDPYLLQAHFVFAKIMTDVAVAAHLPLSDRETLRRHDLSGAHLLDEQIFRWIGAPPDAIAFVERWKTRWPTDTDVPSDGIPRGYIDGATMGALCRMALSLLDASTVSALAGLLQPAGTVQSHSAAVTDVLAGHVGVHPDGNDRWRMHRVSGGRSVCRPIAEVATWERVFGEIGFRVSAHLRPDLQQIDRIRCDALAHVESLFGLPARPRDVAIETEDATRLRDATAYVKASRALRDARRHCTR